jgi:ERCC4-type nuclease
MLAAVPGISTVIARRLLDEFGSVAAVASADAGRLATVEGMGPRRVTALRRAVRDV